MAFKPSFEVKSTADFTEEEWKDIVNAIENFPDELIENYPTVKKPFLNKIETTIFKILRFNFNRENDYEVFSQVNMIRLLEINNENIDELEKKYAYFFKSREKGYALFNEIRLMSHDFVIANGDCIPLCVVEVDGPTHETKRQKFLDKLKDNCLRNAGIVVFRITTKQFNEAKGIPTEILNDIKKTCGEKSKIAKEDKRKADKEKKEKRESREKDKKNKKDKQS